MAHNGAAISVGKARQDGGCTFCSDDLDTDTWTVKPQPVAILHPAYHVNGVKVRLCQACVRDILPQLQAFVALPERV